MTYRTGGPDVTPGNGSKSDYGKTRDSLKVSKVERRYFVAKMQSRRTNQQILERKLNARRFLLTPDSPGQPRDGERNRMHRHIAR
jgi:hypothetical protein